jgi:hypothetical protein
VTGRNLWGHPQNDEAANGGVFFDAIEADVTKHVIVKRQIDHLEVILRQAAADLDVELALGPAP